MELAYFPGCKISFYAKDYDLSFRSVMQQLDIDLIELPFNCCGYPARDDSIEVSVLSGIRNFAIARDRGLDIITPCKCCFGQLKHAVYWYDTDPALKKKTDDLLALEGLAWGGGTRVRHLLSFLYHDIGLEKFGARIRNKLPPERVAVQYGCHALRPFSITGFDNPFAPRIFERLLSLTGVVPVDWSKSTECCGHPVMDGYRELSLKIVKNKLDTAKRAGADYICTACTHCQMQYESLKFEKGITGHAPLPISCTQIFGAALGIPVRKLSKSGRLPASLS